MERIIVIGCPGAGKSTFARRLRDLTGLPLHHLDMIWHLPDRSTITEAEFDQRLDRILAQDRWIIDGNYGRTLEKRLERCDAVFLLDLPAAACLEGARERIGRPREDLPWTEEELDPEFRQWIEDFPRTQLPGIYRALDRLGAGKEIHIFRSREEADRWAEEFRRTNKSHGLKPDHSH